MRWFTCFVVCGLLLGTVLPARADALRVISPVFGNVFTQGEAIIFDAEGAVQHLDWRLLDLDGHVVAEGSRRPHDGRALIYLPAVGTGYYRLAVTAVDDGGGATSDQPLVVVSKAGREPADSRFNVVTHFALGWAPDLMPLIGRAGIAGLRDELPWAAIETTPGRFVFPAPLEEYGAAAHRLHLDMLVPLTYANPLYDGGDTPHSPEAIAAYARYAGEVVRHFGSRIGAVEVWNEYNGAFARGPVLADRPNFYAKMLQAASAAVKAARRETTVVGGGVAGVPVPYFRQLFDRQALGSLDAVQVHPYFDVPEDAEYDVASLRRLIALRSPSRPVPIWATESGSYDQRDRRGTAGRLIRLTTVLLAQGVGRIYWYLLRDTTDYPMAGLLENAGTPAAPYAPTPSYASYATLIRELHAARYRDREPTDPRSRLYRFDGPGGQIRVAWSEDGMGIELRTDKPLTIVRADGREATMSPHAGAVPLELGPEPVFIRGAVTSIGERRTDRVVADSAADFSDRQEAAGWSYGAEPSSEAAAPAPIRLARWAGNDWGDFWADPALPLLSIGRFSMHPSLDGDRPVGALRRWRSPVDGTATLAFQIERIADQGDGVDVRIRVDGTVIRQAALGTPGQPKRLEEVLPVKLHKGSIVDCAIFPATAKLDFDNTAVRIRITVPGPRAISDHM